MSTKCHAGNWLEFTMHFDTKLKEIFNNKDDAIKVYSECISEGEDCLNVINESLARKKLCQQLALGYNERGLVRYQKVDFDDAVEDFTKALSYNNKLHVTYYNRGLIHYRLGRFDEAMEDMKRTLQLKPDFQSAQKCLQEAQTDKQKALKER